MNNLIRTESWGRATLLQSAACRTSHRSYCWHRMAAAALALSAFVPPAAQAGVEFVSPIGTCSIKADVIGDDKDLFIIAGSNVQFEVFGNFVDVSNPTSDFRIATDSGAGSVSARIIKRRNGPANDNRGCGNIGSAEVEVDSPAALTSNIQRSLYFKMPLGDESRLQMTIKAYPTINVIWTSVQTDIGCIVKTGTFEKLDQNHKIRIKLPVGHEFDRSFCDQYNLVAQVSPADIGELDIPTMLSATIGGWEGFNYAIAGLPASLQALQFKFTHPRDSRKIDINISGARTLTDAINSTITVRSPNPNGNGTLYLEIVPSIIESNRPQMRLPPQP